MKLVTVRQDRWKVLAACSDRGDCPLLDYLNDDCTEKERDMILALLGDVASNGPPRNVDVSHQIDEQNHIFEFIKGNHRIPYFYDQGQVVICSHGFRKVTQKTPKAEIAAANRSRDPYIKAKGAKGLVILTEDAYGDDGEDGEKGDDDGG